MNFLYKLLIVFGIQLVMPFPIAAQYNSNQWCFGDSAGIDWTDNQNPILFTSAIKGRGSCVSLSDSNAILLYGQTDYGNQYLNRTRLFNRYWIFRRN